MVLNTLASEGDEPTILDWSIPSTLSVKRVRRELLSIEEVYRELGYEMHLRQPQNGISELTNKDTGGNVSILIRHDNVHGGFWIDYIPVKDVENRPKHMTRDAYIAQQMALLRHN